ncbi:MAG: nucleotidyltransferase domain-containing protein [Oscillospiraceae bacterium]|nr:nucleotidyltransferase domain-containing protein [Oscillospiraceae bacterium]MBQ6974396.1 nucleotidyltransferase domain-containing protein [Oscillospiraceae bacterium]
MLTVQKIEDCVRVASREYPLRKVELFGSYASGKNTPQSDVDLLVEFVQPRVSLLTLNALKLRMEELLGTEVDIVHGPLPEDSMLEVDRRVTLYGA